MRPLIDTLTLRRGSHQTPEAGMCVMEAVAYVAGEPHSDHPACVSPVIAAFLRRWNDDLPDDATRTRLLAPLIPVVIGTATTDADETTRAWLAVDWVARVCTPAWLDAAGLTDHASALRALAPVTDDATAAAARPMLIAAGDAAWAAARAAARDAAGDAAWAAAGAAAGAAARAAAGAASGAAARAAARAAAWDAAGAAAGDALAPTAATLQTEAVALVHRMAAVGRTGEEGQDA